MPAPAALDPWTRRGPALLALADLALHAACGGRYGVFRDELYFIACGERLAWGYVDQPPLVAVVARAAHALFGTWVPGLRLLPWLSAALTVYLAGRLAAALGAGARGATLASAGALACGLLAALGHYLTMNAFEPLLWTALALALARAAAGDRPELLPAAGGLAAASFLFKYSVAPFALFLVAGLLATPARRLLARREAALAAGLGLLLVLPNLAWQWGQGLPFLELVRNGQLHKNAPFAPGAFLKEVVLQANPLALPLWAGGAAWLLLARGARRFRFLGIAAALQAAFLVLTRAKPYYFAPLLPLLLAAGGAAAEPALRSRPVRNIAVGLLVASAVAIAPATMPLLPVPRYLAYARALGLEPERLERKEYGALPQIFADQHGWRELARGAARAVRALAPDERSRAVIFGDDYGQAAALELYGEPGLPPVVSGHNQYWLWGLPAGRGEVLVRIASPRDPEPCQGFRRAELALRMPEDPDVMPYESGLAFWICRDPARPLAELWAGARNYE